MAEDDNLIAGYEVRDITTVEALPETDQIGMTLELEDGNIVAVVVRSTAIGPMVAALTAEYPKVSVASDAKEAVVNPMTLTGVRPAYSQHGAVLMFQFNDGLELAVLVSDNKLKRLYRAVTELMSERRPAIPKLH
jgi:hypothetical protein